MNSIYQSNIQPLQGCNIQFIVDRGFTPTVIQIVPLRGTFYIEIKRISSICVLLLPLKIYLLNTLNIIILNGLTFAPSYQSRLSGFVT